MQTSSIIDNGPSDARRDKVNKINAKLAKRRAKKAENVANKIAGRRAYTSKQVRNLALKLGMFGNSPHEQIAEKLKQSLGWNDLPWRIALVKYFENKPVVEGIDIARHAAEKRRKEPKATKVNGVDVTSNEFLQTYEWRVLRMKALKRDGARCVCCGATPATGAIMNVDHIRPRRLYPSLALELDNLQVLCHECNHGKGNWDMTDWRSSSQIAETS